MEDMLGQICLDGIQKLDADQDQQNIAKDVQQLDISGAIPGEKITCRISEDPSTIVAAMIIDTMITIRTAIRVFRRC